MSWRMILKIFQRMLSLYVISKENRSTNTLLFHLTRLVNCASNQFLIKSSTFSLVSTHSTGNVLRTESSTIKRTISPSRRPSTSSNSYSRESGLSNPKSSYSSRRHKSRCTIKIHRPCRIAYRPRLLVFSNQLRITLRIWQEGKLMIKIGYHPKLSKSGIMIDKPSLDFTRKLTWFWPKNASSAALCWLIRSTTISILPSLMKFYSMMTTMVCR